MANQELLDLLKQGVEQWNEWRREHLDVQPDLSLADLSEADLRGVDLRQADLHGANFHGADLSFARLRHPLRRLADIRKSDLCRTDLRGADLGEANLKHVNLRGANLSGADLREAYLFDARLIQADLRQTDLRQTIANEAHFEEADLRGTYLRGTDLRGTDLSEANLDRARLDRANLSRAYLGRANVAKADLRETIFAENDLRAVKGLVEINHKGPSRVELYTVKLPQDGSSLHFLRGTGVPDEWIDFYRSSMMQPIQYHSCFISYAHQDKLLARRLHADLQDQGVRCWFAPEDMKIGDKIRARIDEAIHLQDKLLLLLSEHSIASAWVEDEVEAALEKEHRQQWEVLFPVRLDESVMQTPQAWAAKLRRTRHIGDFTHWTDPQAYLQAFELLLRDLKAKP